MEKAKPQWIDDSIPYSSRFDDTYYSKIDGQKETQHVYLGGNGLPQRWKGVSEFTIAELGFGTGLNFLETARQWEIHQGENQLKEEGPDPLREAKTAKLNYVSFELYPLEKSEIMKALSPWPELFPWRDKLLEKWEINSDVLKVEFPNNINLTLYFDDANETLCNLNLSSDAWFLDGFSPSKNPELWNQELMQTVFDSTKPGGTFATFSVAAMVRNNLQNAGFSIEKTQGFAAKLHMLRGIKEN